MFGYISRLLDSRSLSPHGFCLLWRPELLWTHVVSDALIFTAYMTIPAALAVIIRRRKDIPYGWVIWCFAIFITACGFGTSTAVVRSRIVWRSSRLGKSTTSLKKKRSSCASGSG